jgi:hypothetical protein
MEKIDHTEEDTETNVIGEKTSTAAKMTIINKTGDEVSTLYIRENPSEDDEWGDERIENAFTLKDGEKAVYYYEQGEESQLYDIRIGYTTEGKNECFFRKLPLNTITQITLCMDGSGEDGIPYARYLTEDSKKEISTLDDVKRRLGLLDSDDGDETLQETDEPQTDGSGDDSDTSTASPDDEENPGDTDDPQSEPDDPVLAAENCIGRPLSELIAICGEPNGTTYEDEPETGETGYHYYDDFTVSTTVDEAGNEVVAGVW